MKLLKGLIFLTLLYSNTLCHSQSFKDVYNSPNLVWFGLDFSNAKMVGNFSGPIIYSPNSVTVVDGTQIKPEIIRDDLYMSWNDLILNEPDRYDLKKNFKKKEIIYSTETVKKINSKTNLDSIKIAGNYNSSFNKEKIQIIINEYKLYPQKITDGIGVSFIVEKFDKIQIIAVIHIAFFDLKHKP